MISVEQSNNNNNNNNRDQDKTQDIEKMEKINEIQKEEQELKAHASGMYGLDIIEIPEYTYAVFKCVGPMPYAFIDTYKKIVTEFFPQNDKFEYAYGLEFEVYPSDKVNDKDYTCEIWIAVKEKK